MNDEPCKRIGDYEIVGTLGAGGMGRVYRVRNVISDRVEAMKILLPSLSEHPEVGDRFLREIKLVASLHHPNIANLCTALAVDNQLLMVMEFVDGQSFSDLLDHGPLPMPHALNYFDQSLSALAYAHSKGIVHRDLKPGNVMLTEDGVVKLMDFGIARGSADRALTQTGATVGTVSYMSPEQIAGKPTDARSDIYSMGIFFYEAVTGVQPFKGDSDYELMAAHMQQTARLPLELVKSLSPGLNDIIMKMIAKSPDDRFQTAESVRDAIRAEAGYESSPLPLNRRRIQSNVTSDRSATVVEGYSPTGSTALERPAVRTAKTTPIHRPVTEVSPRHAYAPPAALALPKKGFARHPVLYAVGGTAFTLSAIALPLLYSATHKDSDRTKKDVAVVDGPTPQQPEKPVVRTPVPRQVGGVQPQLSISASAAVRSPVATPAPAAVAVPGISAEIKAKLDEEELHIDGLANRSVGINNSLNTMQRSMQADGVSMRGDIAAKQASMNNNLGKARQALATHDADRAGKFAALAESDITALDAFLGH